jgi:dynein heavy chain
VEQLIADISQKTEIASKQQAEASETKAFLDVQSVKIAKEKAEADEQLKAAEPAVEAAQAALNEVNQKDLVEVKAM